jgi:hypothetical protein
MWLSRAEGDYAQNILARRSEVMPGSKNIIPKLFITDQSRFPAFVAVEKS